MEESYPKTPIFTVNSSRYISRLANYKKTLFDLLEEDGPLTKHAVQTVLVPQIRKFYDHLLTFNQ